MALSLDSTLPLKHGNKIPILGLGVWQLHGSEASVAVKAALDPHGILNPGKLALPDPFGDVGWP